MAAVAIVRPSGPPESLWLHADAAAQILPSARDSGPVTIQISGTLRGEDGAVSLGVGRGDTEAVVRFSFHPDSDGARRSLGLGQAVRERLVAVPAPGEGPVHERAGRVAAG